VKVRVVVVGRVRDASLAQAVSGYEQRAARYWPLEIIEVREGTGKDPAAVKRQEGERLLERAGAGMLVACDERGDALPSNAFAEWLQRLRDEARDVAFVLGGAHGLDGSVIAKAHRRLTLAPFTLPHDLARLVLAEQLYRAGTIVRREPYHKP
jgi:23S rRNA (pseudouridine1915-N3)-methyltransferase